ncbi:patatin-like phospholipase family protein [Nocardia blacklockiae]|uniref:patatin-like phospholipase family protein n=1 Tax=Nocardia blacklockiae TaxID=480036 RepID=UPI001893C70E|nr:patatin-like phospholipase family protein [Nocardia blacklockiae]MBF6170625.1 patatin-like phospholipase family protein [Nocardia blacklockiae]
MTAMAPDGFRSALVLGGGGPVGISWMAGLVTGLRAAGVDPARADRFVGTSAGAVVGTVLAGGGEIAGLLRPPSEDVAPVRAEVSQMSAILATVAAENLSPAQARRRVGELALEARVGDPAEHVARIAALIGRTDWPAGDLIVTSVDVATGELRAWTAAGEATVAQAVAASTAVPGVFPPIPIGDGHYIDGGMRSPVNADLAAGAEVVVIAEPLAHMFPRTRADAELGSAATISIVPDTQAIAAFGPDVFARAALVPAYEAGVRQAAEAAIALGELWPAA